MKRADILRFRIRRLWRGIFKRRIPFLPQLGQSECGAACLAMLLNHFGCRVSVSRVVRMCVVGRHGISAASMVSTAKQFGITLKVYSADLDALRALTRPAILHWGFNHWVIQEGWERGKAIIVDPASGRRLVDPEEMGDYATGVVMIPVEQVEPIANSSETNGKAFREFLRSTITITGVRRLFFIAFGGALLGQALGLVLALSSQVIIDRVVIQRIPNILYLIMAALGAVIVSKAAVDYIRSVLLVTVRTRLDQALMKGLVAHLLRLPLQFYHNRSVGDLLNRLSSYSIIRQVLSDQALAAVLNTVFLCVYVGVIGLLSVRLMELTLGLILLQSAATILRYRSLTSLVRLEYAADADQQSALTEMLKGIYHLKATGKGDAALDRWQSLLGRRLDVSSARGYQTALVDAVTVTTQMAAPFVVVCIAALQTLAGAMTLGQMFAAVFLVNSALQPLNSLLLTAQGFMYIIAYVDRLDDILSAETEPRHAQLGAEFSGSVEVRHLTFCYPGEQTPALRDVSFRVEPGSKTAVIGATGSGKSTLLLVLLGLYRPQDGVILYDGQHLDRLSSDEFRQHIGVVLQDDVLFSGSVWRNLTLGVPDASYADVIQAAKQARIHDEIMALSGGYESVLSEGGRNFSGGQRQRMALARALVAKPRLLMLDEATSHLDGATEAAIDTALDALSCTRIVISHRLSTVANADQIIVLDGGQVVEAGTPQQLLSEDGYYARMCSQSNPRGHQSEDRTAPETPLLYAPYRTSR
jgi:ATP-binding cassette subfamily B protein